MTSTSSQRLFRDGSVGLITCFLGVAGCAGDDVVPCELPRQDPRPVALSSTGEAVFARFSDGSIFCWGQDDGACGGWYAAQKLPDVTCLHSLSTLYAGAGLGPSNQFTVWNFVPAIPFDDYIHRGELAFSRAPRDLVAGGVSLWALDEHGLVWMIGNLADGSDWLAYEARRQWTPVPAPVRIVKIPQPGCGIGEDQNLYCADGLRIVDYFAESRIERTLTRVPLPEDVLASQNSGWLACVLGTSGTLRCFGTNVHDLLGVPRNDLPGSAEFRPVAGLPPLSRFKMSDTGANMCGQSTDGRLLCWGNNGFGEIVDDPALDFYDITTPTEVGQEFSADILDFVINSDSLCILRASDSTIWCRGFVGTGHCDLKRGWREVSYEPCVP